MYFCSIIIWGGLSGMSHSVQPRISSCGCTLRDPSWHRSTKCSIFVPLSWDLCSWLLDRELFWSLACSVLWYLLKWSPGRRLWRLWVRGWYWSLDICDFRSPVVLCLRTLIIWIYLIEVNLLRAIFFMELILYFQPNSQINRWIGLDGYVIYSGIQFFRL